MEALQMRKWNHQPASRDVGVSKLSRHRDETQLARLGKREVLTVSNGYLHLHTTEKENTC